MAYRLKDSLKYNIRDLKYYFFSQGKRGVGLSPRAFVLCNSFPKSGTHLLLQILQELGAYSVWPDLVSSQGWSGFMNTKFHIRYKLASVANDSLVRGHLYYCPEVLHELSQYDVKRFFIYRDPRDVAYSYMKYILNEPKGYMSSYLRSLSDESERLAAVIKGVHCGDSFGLNVSLPPMAEECRRYQGWIHDSDTLGVKFEDLVGERGGGNEYVRMDAINKIAKHLGIEDSSRERIASLGSLSVDPSKSHTFRKGRIGSWEDVFTDMHKDLFKHYGGEILVDLGYEKDMNW